MSSEKELKLGVFLAAQLLPQLPITVVDPHTGIVGRFFFNLEVIEDEQFTESGYVPLRQQDIKPGADGVETVMVTVRVSSKRFQHMPQTGTPWSKLLICLGQYLIKPIADLFPDDSTHHSSAWIVGEIQKALEQISAIQEALTKKDALEKFSKLFQSQGFKVNSIHFSHFRFEQGLENNRLLSDYKFIGTSVEGEVGELTARDLQGVLAQVVGLKQLEIVRPDNEGGALEFSLITGWSRGPVLMLPRTRMLPDWASRMLPNIGLIFVYENMEEINFTAEERSAFNTADFAKKNFQPAYVLALKAGRQAIEAALIGRRNHQTLPNSLVKIKWDENIAQTQENFVARVVWAARWSLAQVPSIDPADVVKAGIYLEEAGQRPFITKGTLVKELKAALASDAAPMMGGLSPDLANTPAEICLSAV